MRGECVHTHDYSVDDDDNPTSVSQKGKMGEERRGGEAGMNARQEGGQKNRWKVGQKGSHSVGKSGRREGELGMAERKSESMAM